MKKKLYILTGKFKHEKTILGMVLYVQIEQYPSFGVGGNWEFGVPEYKKANKVDEEYTVFRSYFLIRKLQNSHLKNFAIMGFHEYRLTGRFKHKRTILGMVLYVQVLYLSTGRIEYKKANLKDSEMLIWLVATLNEYHES